MSPQDNAPSIIPCMLASLIGKVIKRANDIIIATPILYINL